MKSGVDLLRQLFTDPLDGAYVFDAGPRKSLQTTELLEQLLAAFRPDAGYRFQRRGPACPGTPLPVAVPDDEYLRGMYAAGAAAYFDVLGLNAPGYKAPPQTSPEEGLQEIWGGIHQLHTIKQVGNRMEKR